jgi:UDP-glucose 4-epimerase
MNILVTGGAGYVGSVIAEELLKQGINVVVFDNLQQGHRKAILPSACFVLGDCCDIDSLRGAFSQYDFDAVMHMAGETIVSESNTDPGKFFRTNICGGINLLNIMLEYGVKNIIFSSSAAVYGEPPRIPIIETDPCSPINSYGETKLMFEKILYSYKKAYGLKYISFRYFNAAGASSHFGEDHHPETHLIPNVLRAALKKTPLSIFGIDFPTKDGTCIRDYVHVVDIAQAHLQALRQLDSLNGQVFNLGSGQGYSVLEVLKTAEHITREKIITVKSPRRIGDPAVLLASSQQAAKVLGWKPRYDTLSDIIGSSWKWMRTFPNGYNSLS